MLFILPAVFKFKSLALFAYYCNNVLFLIFFNYYTSYTVEFLMIVDFTSTFSVKLGFCAVLEIFPG